MPCTLERPDKKQMKVIEQKIRSVFHSTVFLWLVIAFLHNFSSFRVCLCLCLHFVCFSSVSRTPTQIVSLLILAAILNQFPLCGSGQIGHMISAVCQGLLLCRRHIGKREDPAWGRGKQGIGRLHGTTGRASKLFEASRCHARHVIPYIYFLL